MIARVTTLQRRRLAVRLTVVSLLGILTIGAFMLPLVILLALTVRLDPGSGDASEAPLRSLATAS